MTMRPATDLATRISQAIISASNRTRPARKWTPLLEQTLHQLGLRDSLSPSLVARVINPYLLTHHSLALGFFNWASQQPNFTHSPLSYHSILKSLSLSRQINAIDSVLKQVKVNKITLDSSVYRFIIPSLIQGKNTQKAFSVFNEVKFNCEDIGPEICNSLLAVLASDGYIDNALKMFDEMSHRGRLREAYGVIQEMKRKGLDPDVSFYNSLMEACCREDLLRPAKKLWDQMFASGCSGNLKTYNILISKFSEVGEIEGAMRLFHNMLEKGVSPDAATYTSLLEGLCQETNLQAAFEVFNKSVNQDVMLARSILSPFMISLCRRGHFLVATKLLRGLSSDLGHSDSHVILLKSLADAREVEMAIEHIKWIQESSPTMLQEISEELFASLSSSSYPEPILLLLHALQEKCLDSEIGAGKGCSRS